MGNVGAVFEGEQVGYFVDTSVLRNNIMTLL